jgi:hypothetical protein
MAPGTATFTMPIVPSVSGLWDIGTIRGEKLVENETAARIAPFADTRLGCGGDGYCWCIGSNRWYREAVEFGQNSVGGST